MDPLETLLRPLTGILNRNISETTPARDLCRELDGKTVGIRVRDTGLAMYFEINDEVLTLKSEIDAEPDVVLTGSLLTLARMAGPAGDDSDGAAIRSGSLGCPEVLRWSFRTSDSTSRRPCPRCAS